MKKIEPIVAIIKHDASGSLMFLQIENIKGRTKITESRFAKGNVINLTMVSKALSQAKKEFAGR
jgi:hypothetical protein